MLSQVVRPPATTAPVPNPVEDLLDQLADPAQACGTDPNWLCRKVYDWTGNADLAGVAEWLVSKPLRLALIAGAAWLIVRVARRALSAWFARLAAKPGERRVRTEARVQTLTTVSRSLVATLVWFVAVLAMLDVVGISLAPFLLSAGIIGVALGFGAQSIVRDFLAGFFLVTEDQYGVGDIIDLGEAKGTVEEITLRVTRLRDVQGTVWHVPNGEIRRVANKSQEWARAVLDVEIDWDTDEAEAERVLLATAEALAADPDWQAEIVNTPEVWGVEAYTSSGPQIRLVVTTRPASQFGVLRELRARLLDAFAEAGLRFAGEVNEVTVLGEPPEPRRPRSAGPPTRPTPAVRGDQGEFGD